MTDNRDLFQAKKTLDIPNGPITYYDLKAAAKELNIDLASLPFTIRVLLENVLRHSGNGTVTWEDVETVGRWYSQGRRSGRHSIYAVPRIDAGLYRSACCRGPDGDASRGREARR